METKLTSAEMLADTLAASFEIRERQSGGTFHALKDNAPEWVRNAVKDAHHDGYELRLCDDWIYQQCDYIASDIRQKILHDEIAPDELLENLQLSSDDYTSSLLSWLSSHRDNLDFCNQYAETHSDLFMVGDGRTGLEAIIAGGQLEAKREIASAMVNAYLNELKGAE